MARCRFCGEGAGFLRSFHKDCSRAHRQARSSIVSRAAAGALAPALDGDALERELFDLCSEGRVGKNDFREALVSGFEVAVEKALDDELLSHEEEAAMTRFQDRFGLAGDPSMHKAQTRITQGTVLRQVCEGSVPEVNFSLNGSSHVPFNLQKSEQLVWLMANVDYYQMKTRREFRGSSTGMSVRIAKGVYLRQSAFRGHPVEITETVKADTGLLGLTTKHIYFHGQQERFRVRYDKIVSFEPYENGLGYMRDLARAKPETFETPGNDGWFLYNLVTNLAQL